MKEQHFNSAGMVRTCARLPRRKRGSGNVHHERVEMRVEDRRNEEAAEKLHKKPKSLPMLTLLRAMLASCDRCTAWREVVILASTLFCVPVKQIRSGCRDARVSFARSAAMIVMYERVKMSFPEVGAVLRRSHSTVISATQRMNRLLSASAA